MSDAPIAWIVKWTQKSIPPEYVSAYVKEEDAKRAAENIERYADCTNVVVIPAYAAPNQSEYGWVIEAGWTVAPSLEYWCGCVVTGGGGIQHEWRPDHARAVRFAREKDAKQMALTLIDGESYRVVEHAWDEPALTPAVR